MKFLVVFIAILLFTNVLLLSSCERAEDLIDFTEEDEIALGEKLVQTINEDAEFTIIPTGGNSVTYGYASSRLQEITSASSVTKGGSFSWSIHFLEDDRRQAFAFPGGHLYVSTGMIFFLDNEDQFSGLLAHLVAHINQSHITEALFFKYGVNGLKSIAFGGDQEALTNIIHDLDLVNDFLRFTRENEIQANTLAISILAETGQSCESGALFISKTLNIQPDQQAGFIQAHRLVDSQIDEINQIALENGCSTDVDDQSGARFQSFRNALP